MSVVQHPLEGIRVLDLTHFLAGPYATWVLAELGADVVKVEDPRHPDEARAVGPFFQGGQSLYFTALNGGKRSIALDLGSSDGRRAMCSLVRMSDVLMSNSRPGVMAKLGLGAHEVEAMNPRLVSCSLTGFGESGPYVRRPGYDYTIQALAGVMSMTGEPNDPPGKAGISYVDHTGGLASALAVCAALVSRERTGCGGHLDLALFDIQMSMLTYLAAWNLNAGFVGSRTASASHPSIVPAQNFATKDGYIALFVGNDEIWRRLLEAFPGDEVLRSSRFATGGDRSTHRDILLPHLAALLRERTSAEWTGCFAAVGVPCAEVNDLGQALADEQAIARGMIRETAGAPYGAYRHVGGPFPRLGVSSRPAPTLGQHTDEILSEVARFGENAQRHGASGDPVGTARTTPR